MKHQRGVVTRRLARLLSSLVYREIDVRLDLGGFGSGPTLVVANHFGGLADGIVIVDSLPVMPRIVARDVIWKIPVAGQLMTAIGGIPVHRAADGGHTSNDDMFASCYEALAKQDVLLIFPEGVTQDVPHIAPIKTGAARIALGAHATGVTGIRIVPVGLHYEDKASFRRRVLVNIGPPLKLDEWTATHDIGGGPENREAVRELTDEIDSRLRSVAPNFPDWETAYNFQSAAQIPLYDVDLSSQPLRYGNVEIVAANLFHNDVELATAAGAYREQLAHHRTHDLAVARAEEGHAPKPSQAKWRDLLAVLILLPYAIAGVVSGFIPWLITQAVRLVPAAPAVRATLTPAAAALAFGTTWAVQSWATYRAAGWAAGLATFLLTPVFWAATVYVTERVTLLFTAWRRSRSPDPEALAKLVEQRTELSDRVWRHL